VTVPECITLLETGLRGSHGFRVAYEMLNEVVQQEPATAIDPELMGPLAADRHCQGQALRTRCAHEKDPYRCSPAGERRFTQLVDESPRSQLAVLSPLSLDEFLVCLRLGV
jgi:hypothetical protein